MARLNEVPQPAESLESLKRRFIRQNRELAKNNSNQSVRIRALESEQARLLAENIALREQIIQLQNELDNSQSRHAVQQIGSVKDRLEAKIQELSGLVVELNSLQRPTRERKPEASEPSRSREYFEWRQAIKEQAEEQDEVLPTIREDKYYPRRTLNAEEIRAVLTEDSTESPDLGPPPVAHFQDFEDPVKFDPTPAYRDEELPDANQQEEEELPAAVSVNLETRRKRRDSSAKLDLRKMSVFQSPQDDNDTNTRSDSDQNHSPRAGTKRKHSATIEDLRAETGGKDPRDEFRFNRRGGSNTERGEEARTVPENPTKQLSKLDMLVAAERKALGCKSVNNTSPKKASRTSTKDSKTDAKKSALSSRDASRARVRDQKTKTASVAIAHEDMKDAVVVAEIPVEEEQIELPPKTPAGLDLFSPGSTEPSAREEPRETPSLENPSATAANSEGPVGVRHARRARANVNYAEPNLVSKMRRPTKDLIDAVVDRSRSASAQPEEGKSAPSTANAMRTVVIKRERSDDRSSAWKSLPATSQPEPGSPLSNKTAPLSQKQDTEEGEPEQVDDKPSKSTTAMRDLMSGSSRKTTTKAHSSESSTQDRPDLAIFDFTDSSPAERESNNIMKSSRDFSRTSRRNSSINSAPKENMAAKSGEDVRSKAIKDLKAAKSSSTMTATEAKTDRKASRRRSMMI